MFLSLWLLHELVQITLFHCSRSIKVQLVQTTLSLHQIVRKSVYYCVYIILYDGFVFLSYFDNNVMYVNTENTNVDKTYTKYNAFCIVDFTFFEIIKECCSWDPSRYWALQHLLTKFHHKRKVSDWLEGQNETIWRKWQNLFHARWEFESIRKNACTALVLEW